jgi:hypothetical protein
MLTQTRVCCYIIGLLAAISASACRSAPLRLTVRTIEDTVRLQRHPMATMLFTVTAIARNSSKPFNLSTSDP